MPRIVILDDRITNRRILAQHASKVGPDTDIQMFSNPVVALEYIRGETPDLIITDFRMPEMNGAEFIRRVRALPDGEEIPIIVVSVYKDRDHRNEALEAGATDFLMSPVDPFEFRTRAKNLLTLRRQQLLLKERALNLEHKLESETKRSSNALRESKRQLLAVIDSLPALVYATDKSGKCLFMNQYGAVICGTTPDKAVGRQICNLLGEEKWEKENKRDKELLKERALSLTYEAPFKLPDKSVRTFLTTKTLFRDANTDEEHVLSVAFDITDRKMVEEELKAARDSSEAANQAKTKFLANMSHDLRTPLNAIIGFSEVMASQSLGPIGNTRYLEYAADIEHSGQHLLGVISDMLDLACIEEGKLELTETSVDIIRTIRDVARDMTVTASERNISIVCHVPSDLPRLIADHHKIKQIFVNLLSNAIRFSPDNGVVDLKAWLDKDGSIGIEVRDGGEGMTPDEIEVAKSRFGQVYDNPTTKRYQGTGLGLPISIGFVEAHGGEVRVLSEKNNGTRIIVSFPLERTLHENDSQKGERLASS